MAEIDYYSMVEAAVMAKLRTLSIFSKDWQVSDDVTNIQKGAKYFAIFFPSTFTPTRADGLEKDYLWSVVFDLYVRYSTHKESLALFKAARAELFILNKDRNLNRTQGVFNVNLLATSEVLQDVPGDNPNFIIQTFNAAVSQRIRFAP